MSEDVNALAAAFTAPVRRQILRETVTARTVGELAEPCGVSQPTISRHLADLAELGLVTLRREGMRVYVRANRPAIEAGLRAIRDDVIIDQEEVLLDGE